MALPSKASTDALTRTYAGSLRVQVAYLSEARICEIAGKADEISPNFVKAFEGGRVDCGVYQGPTRLPDDSTKKQFAVSEADTNEKTILPVDLKDIAPVCHKEAIYWIIHVSVNQAKTCQAIIINAAKDPDFIAVLPIHYIRHHLLEVSRTGKHIYSKPFRPLWTLQQLPAFPPELAPFMIPTSSVGQLLANMRAFDSETSNVW